MPFQEFLACHKGQLEQQRVPPSLWELLHEVLAAADVGVFSEDQMIICGANYALEGTKQGHINTA